MPQGKKIYDILSKGFTKKKKDKNKRADDIQDVEPQRINNYNVNSPQFANSRNIYETTHTRSISKNEGAATVNASNDIKGMIHKPNTEEKTPLDNPTAGVIKNTKSAKKTTKKKKRRRTTKDK